MGGKTSNESKKKYNLKTYERIALDIRKDDLQYNKAAIQAAATAAGQSITEYIMQAVKERMDKEHQV